MGIHFTDLLTAAQFHIATARGAALKIEIADRHRDEMAALVERQAREKEANAADLDAARTNYQTLVSKIAEDASATKKAIEETVSRQAALMLEAQASIPNLMIAEETSPTDSLDNSETEGDAPTAPTGKKRGRKSNAEKAAEAAAAAALAESTQGAPADGTPLAEAPAAAESQQELSTTSDGADAGDNSAETQHDDLIELQVDDSAANSHNDDASEATDAGEAAALAVEETPVVAQVVDSLTEHADGGQGVEESSEDDEADPEDETALEAADAGLQDSDFTAPGADPMTAPAEEEELDGFAALDALSSAVPANTEEEFEVPSFLRA